MPTVLRNGRIYTPAGADVSALVIEDGRIVWLGTDDAVSVHLAAAEEIVDLDGALVTPAFVDAHVHTTATGLSLIGPSLRTARSRTDLLDQVARAAQAVGPGAVVLGDGWDETTWTSADLPTAAELDRAGAGAPVYLARVDGHSALVSSALITPGSESESDRPIGSALVVGRAHDRARTLAFEAVRPGQRREAQRAALEQAARKGIGSVHEMAGPVVSSSQDLTELMELAASPDGPGVEVIAYWGELLAIETARRLGASGAAGDLFCDGSLGSHTAALHAPYADAPAGSSHDVRPVPRLTADEVAAHVVACTQAGLQAGFHAIGDAAVDTVLDGVDRAVAELGPRVRAAGHRVEHAEMVSDIARFAASGLIASMQPAFDATWGGPTGLYADRLGAERAAGMNALNALIAAGTALAFGSDTPVTPLDPWGAIRAAAYHRTPSSSISARAAFAAHTRGGWRAARRDGDGSGVLAVGSPATLAVWTGGDLFIDVPDERVSRWSTDPRAAVAGLPDLAPGQPTPECLRTIVRGRVIHDVLG